MKRTGHHHRHSRHHRHYRHYRHYRHHRHSRQRQRHYCWCCGSRAISVRANGLRAALLAGAFALAACDGGLQTLAWELDDAGRADALTQDAYASWYGGPEYYRRWARGLPADPDSFPLGVWMQDPTNAKRFQDIGVRLYFGLWKGPTEEQLTKLAAAGMPTACAPDGVWEQHLGDATIQAWLQQDGPDNAQELPNGDYGPCIEPSAMVSRYEALHATDGSRPVYLSLGRGVAVTDWEGRGTCTGRIEMYPEYAKSADVLSFWIYPLNNGLSIDWIATGMDNLLGWSAYEKPVMAILEASSFTGAVRPSPADLRAEAWLALIHGAAGIEYYCHRWEPVQSDIDCLEDSVTAASLTLQNQQILKLAPVLNSPTVINGIVTVSSASDARVDTMLKRYGGASYVFAIARASSAVRATFSLARHPGEQSAEVLGEDRTISVSSGSFSDDFEPYAVHLYRVTQR